MGIQRRKDNADDRRWDGRDRYGGSRTSIYLVPNRDTETNLRDQRQVGANAKGTRHIAQVQTSRRAIMAFKANSKVEAPGIEFCDGDPTTLTSATHAVDGNGSPRIQRDLNSAVTRGQEPNAKRKWASSEAERNLPAREPTVASSLMTN
jgi:hypothetical protein